MQILTNLNPQSIVIMLCLYKEWHQLQVWIKGCFPRLQLIVTLIDGGSFCEVVGGLATDT